jgi:2-dehydro-3-deoxygluconokinase
MRLIVSDVVTFGEGMVRLSPPHFQRLEQTTTLDMAVGGAEFNVATGVARLGLTASWVSRVSDNPIGRILVNQARQLGVDTSHVVWSENDRMGLYFLEFGSAPRPSTVLYDRKDSAMSRIRPGEVDWASALAGARVFETSGITPALSTGAAEATEEALRLAKETGIRTVYDPNYRSKLWSLEQARETQVPLMQYVDCFVSGVPAKGEAHEVVLGVRGDSPADLARNLAEEFGFSTVGLTIRDSSGVVRNGFTAVAYANGAVYETKTYELEVVDRVGGGDAFTAGFIAGYVDEDVQKALDYGTAFAALKHTVLGDINWTTLDETRELIAGAGLRIRR